MFGGVDEGTVVFGRWLQEKPCSGGRLRLSAATANVAGSSRCLNRGEGWPSG